MLFRGSYVSAEILMGHALRNELETSNHVSSSRKRKNL